MKKQYVYKYFNKQQEVVYVGITENLEARHSAHMGEINFKKYIANEGRLELYYKECNSRADAKMCETILIGKYHPVLNRAEKVEDLSIDRELLPDIEKWENFADMEKEEHKLHIQRNVNGEMNSEPQKLLERKRTRLSNKYIKYMKWLAKTKKSYETVTRIQRALDDNKNYMEEENGTIISLNKEGENVIIRYKEEDIIDDYESTNGVWDKFDIIARILECFGSGELIRYFTGKVIFEGGETVITYPEEVFEFDWEKKIADMEDDMRIIMLNLVMLEDYSTVE